VDYDTRVFIFYYRFKDNFHFGNNSRADRDLCDGLDSANCQEILNLVFIIE
jgi:hypothetical protein